MKSIVAVLLLALAAYASAECSALERLKVKNQWHEAFGGGHNRLQFGLHLWNSFFHDHPDSRSLFSRVRGDNIYSPEFEAHSQRVLSGLDMTISLLDDQEAFAAQLAHLKEQHGERNLKGDYFDWFRNHLLEVLAEELHSKLDFDAWTHCFDYISAGIKP